MSQFLVLLLYYITKYELSPTYFNEILIILQDSNGEILDLNMDNILQYVIRTQYFYNLYRVTNIRDNYINTFDYYIFYFTYKLLYYYLC